MRIVFFTLLISITTFAAAQQINVMSYNIRYSHAKDGINGWCHRKGSVSATIKKYHPDILGTQEVLNNQFRYLKRKLKGYKAIGIGRDDGKNKGERSAVFFNPDVFTLQTSGTFWLSETPEKTGSKGWGASLPRIVTWCKLQHKSTNATLFVFNTHFDHESNIVRSKSAVLLKQKIQEIAGNEYAIVMGDLNATFDEMPYSIFTGGSYGPVLTDAAQQNNEGTFCGFDAFNNSCKRIDYIFVSKNVIPLSYTVCSDRRGNYYPSDHKPIVSSLDLLPKR